MASLKEIKNQFYVRFRVLGKECTKTLSTGNRKEAEAKKGRIEATIHDIKTGRLGIPADCVDVALFVMSDGKATTKPCLPTIVTVQNVVDGFIADADTKHGKRTCQLYRTHLYPIAKKYGTRPAESLTTVEMEAYVRKSDWSSSYRNGILGSLVSTYYWAVRAKIIRENVLADIEKPKKESRGETALISPDDHRKLCETADDFFRSYLSLSWETGARPGEISCLTAIHVDLEQGTTLRHTNPDYSSA